MSYHGYPWLIHRIAYRRNGHKNMHVRGYKEEGTTTTPFDMCVLNETDRFHLAADVIDRVPSLAGRAAYAKQYLRDKLIDHRTFVNEKGIDLPEVLNFKFGKSIEQAASEKVKNIATPDDQ